MHSTVGNIIKEFSDIYNYFYIHLITYIYCFYSLKFCKSKSTIKYHIIIYDFFSYHNSYHKLDYYMWRKKRDFFVYFVTLFSKKRRKKRFSPSAFAKIFDDRTYTWYIETLFTHDVHIYFYIFYTIFRWLTERGR